MKKVRLLLAFFMLILSSDVFAQAAVGTQFTKDGLVYSVTSNNGSNRAVAVVGIVSNDNGVVRIPAEVNSAGAQGFSEEFVWTVKSVSNMSNRTGLTGATEVIVENGVLSVQLDFLSASQSVKKVSLPESVNNITCVYGFYQTVIEEFNIDEKNPYFCCDDLVIYDKNKTELVLYISTTAKKDETSFQVPNTVENIRSVGFTSNNNLKEIKIPASVKSFTNKGTTAGAQLEKFTVDPGNDYFCDKDGILFTKNGENLLVCPPQKKFGESYPYTGPYEVPEGTKVITNRAFNGNTYISSVSFPNSLERIDQEAFAGNTAITQITLPNNATIANGAFHQLWGLTTVNLNNRADFTSAMFTACGRISTIVVPETNPNYAVQSDILYTKNKETLLFCPRAYGTTHTGDLVIPEGTKTIDKNAFEGGCGINNAIIIPSSVELIDRAAFFQAKNVVFAENSKLKSIEQGAFTKYEGTSIEIPASVISLGESCFTESELENITLHEGLTSIGWRAFYKTKIKDLVIPASVETIGSMDYMPSLESITFEKNSKLTELSTNMFAGDDNLKTVIFKEGSKLTTVGDKAFYQLQSLQEVVLPETVTTLAGGCFLQCANLTSVTFREPSQLTQIGSNTFQNCGLTSFVIPSAVKNIKDAAFYECTQLEQVFIPATTETVSNTAFQLCSGLQEINVDHENQKLSSADGILLNKAKTELKIFPAGKTQDHFALLPPSITKIGDYSFYFNKTMKNICIPNKVTSIGERAFSECTNLETITFLCDDKIKSENIKQGVNIDAFELIDKSKVTIYVRKAKYNDYKDDAFYNQFKEIKTSFFVGNLEENEDTENYYEEYIPVDDETVDLLDVRSGVHSYVIPKTASTNAYGEDKTYKVALIGDYAFQNTPSTMKEVITFENVEYIGAKAFKQTTTTPSIENIIFVQKEPQAQLLSTYRFELMPEDLPSSYTEAQKKQYMEIADNQHVYVRKSDNTACQTQWPKYASQIDYKIPGIKIGTKFGTFSREFDVDLLDYKAEDQEDSDVIINWDGSKNRAKVIAFTGFLEQVNPYDNYTYIRMRSINCETESEVSTKPGDGTYIPANTGVLLRAYTEDAKTPEGFYYRIGEDDGVNFHPLAENENVMVEVVVDKKLIQPKEGDYTNYIISGGQYHAISAAGTLAVHKSYMHVFEPEGSNGARVIFGSDEEATGIEEINAALNAEDDAVIYNLNGQRVNGSAKGIVIKNGKKTFVR